MKRTFILAVISFWFSLSQVVLAAESENNVILLMLDGVRWQEMFHGSDGRIDPGLRDTDIFRNLFHSLDGTSVIMDYFKWIDD